MLRVADYGGENSSVASGNSSACGNGIDRKMPTTIITVPKKAIGFHADSSTILFLPHGDESGTVPRRERDVAHGVCSATHCVFSEMRTTPWLRTSSALLFS